MGERKIVGWVVALMPEKKGEPRVYCERGGADMSTDRAYREVFDTYMEATDGLRLVAEWLKKNDLPRLRILPLYTKQQERTAAQERAYVVKELRALHDDALAEDSGRAAWFLDAAIERIQNGKHKVRGAAE